MPASSRRAIGRLAVTCIPAQLWWIAGLRMQGRYGLPILELTDAIHRLTVQRAGGSAGDPGPRTS